MGNYKWPVILFSIRTIKIMEDIESRIAKQKVNAERKFSGQMDAICPNPVGRKAIVYSLAPVSKL